MKKSLNNLVGHKIEHLIFGECEVVEVTNLIEGKFIGKVMKDNSTKKLIFSRNYFKNIEDYESIDLPVFVRKEKKQYKKHDYTKYRNHPLVKSIDWKANQKRILVASEIVEDEDNFDENEE